MADFVENDDDEVVDDEQEEEEVEETPKAAAVAAEEPFDFTKPRVVKYCPICSMPPEYCEYGPSFDKCIPWIVENCPEALSPELLASMLGDAKIGDGEEEKKKKKRGGSGPKKKEVPETRIIIARVQRQKKKYVTAVAGLDTVPDLKIKDAARVFGKKFSSGASVSESNTGAKEVVIQGDVSFELPNLLVSEFKVPPSAIFFLEDGSLRPFA